MAQRAVVALAQGHSTRHWTAALDSKPVGNVE
jgi:hypothetical protein